MITRYNKFIKENIGYFHITREEHSFLKEMGIKNYKFNPETNLIDIYEKDIILSKTCRISKTLPEIRLGIVYGSASCTNHKNIITNLKYFPKEIKEDFYCNENSITSLEYCPLIVGKDFYCSENELTSLKFCPQDIGRDFVFYENNITSLKYCPSKIGRDFDCSYNKLTSLEYCPKKVNDFTCQNNFLSSIEDYPLCIVEYISPINNFEIVSEIVKSNEEIFKNLLDDKIKFHQTIMMFDHHLIKYYKNIPPPKKSHLLL